MMFKGMEIKFRVTTLWVQCMIPLTVLSIRVFGIQRTIKLLCNANTFKAKPKNNNLKKAKSFLRSLKVGVHRARWKGNCISRSIVLQRLLQKNGIKSEILIGVRRNPKFRAHAWVEHQGIPLNAGHKVHQNYQVVRDLNLVAGVVFS